MFLGIEIGGTKLQLGVGGGDGSPLVAFERFTVDPAGETVLGSLKDSATLSQTLAPATSGGFTLALNVGDDATKRRIVRRIELRLDCDKCS